MIFSLDFDDTYSADFGLWDSFILVAQRRDHEVVIVTFRPPSQPIEYNKFNLPVYYTNGRGKRKFMEEQGIYVNVWMDDLPELIVHGAQPVVFDSQSG